jgi:hypothetical protein
MRPTAAAAGAALSLLLASCARHAAEPSRTPPVVRIIATDSGFVVPRGVTSGIVEVRLVNQSHSTHESVLEHFLRPDWSANAFVDSVLAGDDVPGSAEDDAGPGLALPGDSTRIWMDLKPGHYAVTCWYPHHMKLHEARDLIVAPGISHAEPPVTDITVTMADFNYIFDGTWTPGEHRVLVQNSGSEEHEFDPYRLEAGRTAADFVQWVDHHREGPPPAKPLGGTGTFPPGGRVWLPLTLSPGHYVAFCQMPAKIGGKPHYQLGMVREWEVK